MRIVTWNVNSIRARENRVLNWLDAVRPDVLCMQEIKCTEEQFPFDGFETLGYFLTILGQKGYNGVAVASLDAPDEVLGPLPWAEDHQARGLGVELDGIRIVNLYVPNGASLDSDKYRYKLEWLDHLQAWLESSASAEESLLLCGDFNIAPDDRDVFDPDAWRGQVLCSDPERARLAAMQEWGLIDALRQVTDAAEQYTWWDFRTQGFDRNRGLRIDHHLLTAPLAARIESVEIDVEERGQEKPSDHAPVILTLHDE